MNRYEPIFTNPPQVHEQTTIAYLEMLKDAGIASTAALNELDRLKNKQHIAMQECSKGPNTLDQLRAQMELHGKVLSAGDTVNIQTSVTTPLATQVGGNHYKDMKIQPVEYIHANGIGYFEGNVIKYVSRWRQKGGVADLNKAKHFLELLIELEGKNI